MSFTRDLDRIRSLEDRLVAVEAESARLKSEAAATIITLRAENERLRAALEKYGQHTTECLSTRRGTPCICGLDAALKEAP